MKDQDQTQRDQQARDIFLRAVEIESREAQAAYLEGACQRDAPLRSRVEALLAHHRRDSFLEIPAIDEPTTVIGQTTISEGPGTVIGRYKLLQKIGEGGMGVVYMAEQEEPVRRRVALKIIKLGMDTKSVIARFEAERQALALMDHPNIARVLEAGATESGRPYFVMELVRGVKITEYCDEAKLSTRDQLNLFIKVCQAIQSAHQKGIIHRDIKPSNILVTINDGVAVPKVIDFGIAKATEGRLTDKTLFTQFETLLGTPAYMSPEQAVMTSLDIDTRSDIYSLGVLLYELLAGSTPFDAKELMASGVEAMRRTIWEKEPVRPSTKLSQTLVAADVRRLSSKSEIRNPKSETDGASSRRLLRIKETITLLRGDLDWIVMKCLEKDRARRYETANGLASDIQRHLNNEAVLARPPSAAYRFQKLVRRNKLVFGAVTTVAAVLVLGVVVTTWQAARATRSQQNEAKQRQIADKSRQNEAQLRIRAEAQELAARQRAYASDINLAQQALALNNVGRAQELLNRQRPDANQVRSSRREEAHFQLGNGNSEPGTSQSLLTSAATDLRGWEWRYLWQHCKSDALFTLCQETNSIGSLAVSSDGKWMAVSERDHGGLSIWDVQTRREIARLPAGDGQVLAAFSPRERLLAFSVAGRQSATNWQHTIRLWNSDSREIVAELPLPSTCMGLAFSSNGRTLVTSTAGPDGQVALWRMPDGNKLASYSAPQTDDPDRTPFAVAPDMSVAAHVTPFDTVRVIDLASGQERWSAKAAEDKLTALALSSDGKILASGAGYAESTIRLWDVSSGQEISRLPGHRTYIAALMFWPDGNTLASASGDQTIRLWDISHPQNVPPSRVLRGHKLEVWRLALLPDNATLVSGCKDGSVFFWDTTSSRQQSTRIILPGPFRTWCFDPESKSVVTLGHNGSVARWKGTGFQEREPLLDISTDFNADRTLISADTRLLAAGSEQGRIRVWDLHRRALLREWTNGISPQPFAFLTDSKRLITVDRADGVHREWDLTTWKETQSWRGAAELAVFFTPTLSPSERWCLTLNSGGAGLIRDMTTGSERNLNLRLSQVVGAAFSPDEKLFAVATWRGLAKLWDATTLQEATIRGFLLGVHSVAFSPDSQRLAVGGDGIEAIKLWDVESHHELLTLEGQGSLFYRTAFSPDGNDLGSMNRAGLLHIWRAPAWAEIEAAETREQTEARRQ